MYRRFYLTNRLIAVFILFIHCIATLPVNVNSTEQSFTSDSSVKIQLLLVLLLLRLVGREIDADVCQGTDVYVI